MRFAQAITERRTAGLLPLLSLAFLPALIVLTLVCMSLSREEEWARVPIGAVARPPESAQLPVISVRLSRQGELSIGGQAMMGDNQAAAWQRERAALQLLGFAPNRATVAIYADSDVPTENIRRLIEQAQNAGFTQCVLRRAEDR